MGGSSFRSLTEGTSARSCLSLTLLCTIAQDPMTDFPINSAHSLLGCSENLAAYIASKVGAGLLHLPLSNLTLTNNRPA